LLRYLFLGIHPADEAFLQRGFIGISFAFGRRGAALRVAGHAGDLNFRGFMKFFARADRTTGITE
jgi:hypothetical protein